MRSIWIATYEGNEIKIENSWFNGEKLYVNRQLQDWTFGGFTSKLTGHIINLKMERENIKVQLGGFSKVNCTLFIDDKEIKLKKE